MNLKSFRISAFIIVALVNANFVVQSSALADPILADPSHFRIDLYADLAPLGVGPKAPKALQLTITDGKNGFPAGMYVTSPFNSPPDHDGLYRINGPSAITAVTKDLDTPETLVFAQGGYGSGMLITEPSQLRIQRLLADGTQTTFASLGTSPFGPSALAYNSTGNLFVTDFTSGSILRVNPDGSSSQFASIPLPALAVAGAKALAFDASGRYGGGFIAGTFSQLETQPSHEDAIYTVSPDGGAVTPLFSGVSGIELITLGSGGPFGSNLYVSTLGDGPHADGLVFTLAPDGTKTPFLSAIDATDVVFDTKGVLGGGMFVADFNEEVGAARIWRITAVPEPGSFGILASALGILGLVGLVRRKSRMGN